MSEVFVVFPPSTNNSIIYGRNSFSFCCKEILFVSSNEGTTKVSWKWIFITEIRWKLWWLESWTRNFDKTSKKLKNVFKFYLNKENWGKS